MTEGSFSGLVLNSAAPRHFAQNDIFPVLHCVSRRLVAWVQRACEAGSRARSLQGRIHGVR